MKRFIAALIMVLCIPFMFGCEQDRQAGYDEGYTVGLEEGKDIGQEKLDQSYEKGYSEGIDSVEKQEDPEPATVVWYTASGEYYHAQGCSNIADSSTKGSHDIAGALSAGRSPCPDCLYPAVVSASSTAVDNSSSDEQQTQSETVYITDTGEKYHHAGCQYLRQSSIPISLDEAQRLGYGACSRCW